MIYFELAFDKLGNPIKCCYCNCCHYHDRVIQYSTNRVDKEFTNLKMLLVLQFEYSYMLYVTLTLTQIKSIVANICIKKASISVVFNPLLEDFKTKTVKI